MEDERVFGEVVLVPTPPESSRFMQGVAVVLTCSWMMVFDVSLQLVSSIVLVDSRFTAVETQSETVGNITSSDSKLGDFGSDISGL